MHPSGAEPVIVCSGLRQPAEIPECRTLVFTDQRGNRAFREDGPGPDEARAR